VLQYAFGLGILTGVLSGPPSTPLEANRGSTAR
jgi:hypothetical protein